MDPIHLLLCGGYGVGKTMLFSRLSAFQAIPFTYEYRPTNGINEATFLIPLLNGMKMELHIYDVSAKYLSSQQLPQHLLSILQKCEGALVVTDPLRMACATWTDLACDFLLRYREANIPTFLLVNKMDIDQNDHVISSRQFDTFTAGNDQVLDWFYTVSHPELGDLDYSRGHTSKQKPIEDIIRRMVQLALRQRHDRMTMLLSPTWIPKYQDWRKVMQIEDSNS